ncbi:hypothetical protein [Nocardia sp. NRRL S-836]|uniref:hypothetical protein n=1 Tax=Nocardia sp. NRRL S-836 TaxID=1519492 RepID=UPI000AA69062|nr:hypothetical protein [Nocardia sp. NRRL S-836]
MKTAGKALLAAGVATAAAVVSRKWASGEQRERPLTVTVDRAPTDVQSELPDLVARWRDQAEISIRAAAGDKGTELVATPRGDASRPDLRLALRRAKSVLEAGEVVEPDTAPTHPGPMGKALQMVTSRARGGGRL